MSLGLVVLIIMILIYKDLESGCCAEIWTGYLRNLNISHAR
jgi:hypothetical protein